MRYYLQLQYRMLNRQLVDFGLKPWLGYSLGIIVSAGLSLLLFERTDYAGYILAALALGLVLKLNEPGRNNFLKICFPEGKYFQVRLAENGLVILPFVIILAFKGSFLPLSVLIPASFLLAFSSFSSQMNFTIPTPFYKKPFEFTVGFRNTYYVVLLAYFLAFMAVYADNFNMGIFAVLLVFLVAISYYLNPENEFYVWIYNLTPGAFLFSKIKTALLFSNLMCLPVTVAVSIFFWDQVLILIGFQLLSGIYLLTMILAKYSRFPGQVNLPEIGIMAFSVWFPPLLLVMIPYFYNKSVKQLREILT